jgi:hypothetical protein
VEGSCSTSQSPQRAVVSVEEEEEEEEDDDDDDDDFVHPASISTLRRLYIYIVYLYSKTRIIFPISPSLLTFYNLRFDYCNNI